MYAEDRDIKRACFLDKALRVAATAAGAGRLTINLACLLIIALESEEIALQINQADVVNRAAGAGVYSGNKTCCRRGFKTLLKKELIQGHCSGKMCATLKGQAFKVAFLTNYQRPRQRARWTVKIN